MKFNASMPRAKVPEGKTHVVFSIKTCRGSRLELDGEYDEAEILKMWATLSGLQTSAIGKEV